MRGRDKSLHIPNIDLAQKFAEFVILVMRDCPLRVTISRFEEEELPSFNNVLYVFPLTFMVDFYILLDPLTRKRMILVRAQLYHFTPQLMVCPQGI